MAGADPDAPPRLVTLPAAWDDAAAAALAELAPGERAGHAGGRGRRLDPPGRANGRCGPGWRLPLAERLHRMLLLRHGAPTAAGLAGPRPVAEPGFVLNLAVVPRYRQRLRCGRHSPRRWRPRSPR